MAILHYNNAGGFLRNCYSPLQIGVRTVNKKRVVVIDVVGLSSQHFRCVEHMPHMASLLNTGYLLKMRPVFPAVTLPVQASITTGAYPETHGIVSNGFYFPEIFQGRTVA